MIACWPRRAMWPDSYKCKCEQALARDRTRAVFCLSVCAFMYERHARACARRSHAAATVKLENRARARPVVERPHGTVAYSSATAGIIRINARKSLGKSASNSRTRADHRPPIFIPRYLAAPLLARSTSRAFGRHWSVDLQPSNGSVCALFFFCSTISVAACNCHCARFFDFFFQRRLGRRPLDHKRSFFCGVSSQKLSTDANKHCVIARQCNRATCVSS